MARGNVLPRLSFWELFHTLSDRGLRRALIRRQRRLEAR